MKPFAAFLKMQLNVNYGVSALKYRFTREKKKLWEPILIAVVIPLSLGPLLVLYTMMMNGIFTVGRMMEQPEIVLTISFLFAMLVIMLFGIFYIMGTFFFSKDMESLVPLPLKPYEVVGGKFAVILVNEYLTAVPLLLPPLIIYGVGMGKGVGYWIESLLMILAAPSMPLAAAAIVIMILMRFVNFRRAKDLIAVLGGLLAMGVGVGINVFVQSIPKTGDTNYIQNMLTSKSGLIELIGKRFPPSVWATKGLSEAGLTGTGYLLLFLAICVLLFLALLWLSNLLFYKSLLAGQEVTRKRKDLTKAQMDLQYGRTRGPVAALMKREWKLLFRTPVYVLNGLAGTIVGPLIVLVMFAARSNDPDAQQIFQLIHAPGASDYVLLIGLGLMLFTAGMNLVASTSLSREGQTFWITKLIPVHPRQQVTAKLLLSYMVSAAGVLVTGAILWALLDQPIARVLVTISVGLLGSIPMASSSLLLDIFHPKLIWNSEQEAMKQNMNSSIGMLLSLLIMALLGLAVFLLMKLHATIWVIFGVLSLLCIVMGIGIILALYQVAERKYRELEA